MRRIKWICLILVLFLLAGCGEPAEAPVPQDAADMQNAGGEGSSYTAPPFADSAFHEDKAIVSGSVKLDISAVSDGYVAVSATSEKRLKFQVVYGESTYNYDIASDGRPSIFPLQSGSGSYRFRVMENTTESKYAELYATGCDVALIDEFQPFLRPNDYIDYSPDSACVKKAGELAQTAGSALDVVSAVYEYITDNIKYDSQKAGSVESVYLPDPDETLSTGKGICFDYASLAGAMLRSQGIPTKEIFGYVSPDDLYHAWNMFYTEQTGWVVVSFEVKENTWNRIDLTFAANGTDEEFIGDGSNYSDLYSY